MGTPWLALVLCTALLPSEERELRFEGNQGLSGRRLQAELAPWIEDLAAAPDDPGTRDDFLYEVVGLYRKFGFPDATATLVEETTEAGSALVVRIREGPRAYLQKEVTFVGARLLDDEVLQGAFPWLRPSLIPGSRPIYTKGALDAGMAGIRLLYSLEGYLQAKVEALEIDDRRVERDTSSEIGPPEDPVLEIQVRVVIRIQEGPRSELAELAILPGASTPEETLRAFAGVAEGSPVTPRLSFEVRGRVLRKLQDRGYYRCEVSTELIALEPHRFRLVIGVNEGEPYRFGEVVPKGADRTRRGFIRARLGIERLEPYSATKLEEGQRDLNATGLFTKFDIELVELPESPRVLHIHITVEERDAIGLEARVGFSTYELGRLGAGVQHRNLFGLGIQGRLFGLMSFKGEEVEGRLRYPYLFDRNVALTLRGKYRRFEEVTFQRQENLATIALEVPTGRHLRLTGGFELRDEIISEVDNLQVTDIIEDSRAHVIFLGARHDDRDNVLDPTRGSFLTGRFEYSDEEFGSDLDFVRVTARGSRTDTLGDEWRLSSSLQTGVIQRIDDGEVPLGERFFLGGARTVRSYRQDRIPPLDDFDKPIGGEAFLVGSLEARRRLWGSISGAVFVDAGSLSTDLEGYAGKNWRFASGLGAVWNSPIGPLRVDWALTLNPQRGEDYWAVHVLLGQPF